MAHNLRLLLRMAAQHEGTPSAVILDRRTVQSTPESGVRAGFDGHKKRNGTELHAAVDTLGHLLALNVRPANEQDREQVAELSKVVQEVTGQSVEVAFVDQGYTRKQPEADAAQAGLKLEVVKHPGPSEALCCCCDAGWRNERLRGRQDSAVWLAMMNAWLQPRQVIIGWPLLFSCSKPSLLGVLDRL